MQLRYVLGLGKRKKRIKLVHSRGGDLVAKRQ